MTAFFGLETGAGLFFDFCESLDQNLYIQKQALGW